MLLRLSFPKPCGVHSNEVGVMQKYKSDMVFWYPCLQIHFPYKYATCEDTTMDCDDAFPQLPTYFVLYYHGSKLPKKN